MLLFVGIALVLPPYALWREGGNVLKAMRAFWLRGFIGGALQAASYAIALWAMTLAPIAIVASLRETSVLFGAVIAVAVLKEPLRTVRVAAAVLIVCGLIMIRLYREHRPLAFHADEIFLAIDVPEWVECGKAEAGARGARSRLRQHPVGSPRNAVKQRRMRRLCADQHVAPVLGRNNNNVGLREGGGGPLQVRYRERRAIGPDRECRSIGEGRQHPDAEVAAGLLREDDGKAGRQATERGVRRVGCAP
jgi:uncharacterized membrane protein